MLAQFRVEPGSKYSAIFGYPIVQCHKGPRNFTEICICNANDERFLDRRVLVEHIFNLAWEHLKPANGDHVLQPVNDEDKAFFVNRRDIAGAQILAEKHFCIRLWPIPISAHNLWTRESKLAGFAR